MSFFKAKLTSKKQLADNTFEFLFLVSDQGFTFCAGQYIWLYLKTDNNSDSHEIRAFSIASSSNNPEEISIIFRISEKPSTYKQVLSSLEVSSEVKIRGPQGFVFNISNYDFSKDLFMIAGGVGIAPFLSILRSSDDCLRQDNQFNDRIKKTLVLLNSDIRKQFLLPEISEYCEKNNTNFLHKVGYLEVRDILKLEADFNLDYKKTNFFICGSKSMVNNSFRILSDVGVDINSMFFEQYYPDII
jgi:ferredoxin-NADP reductase